MGVILVSLRILGVGRTSQTDKNCETFAVEISDRGLMINTQDTRGLLRWKQVGLVVALALTGPMACHREKSVVFDLSQDPRQIELSQLASNVADVESNTYAIYQKSKTVGRFPCSLAVIRVRSELQDNPNQQNGRELVIDLLPEPGAVPWAELFDSFPAITTVKVMGRPAVKFEQVTVDELIQAARKQHTSLVLVYGQNDQPDDKVKLVGALYDCNTRELAATIDSQVEPIYGLPTPPDRLKQDRRHEDSECLTRGRFQELVLYCMDELTKMDTPSTTTQPNPWDRPGVEPMLSPWTSPRYGPIYRFRRDR